MREPEQLRLHPTKAGGVNGPVLGRFSSKDVLFLGLSLLVGLMVFILSGSILAASAVPLATLALVLALAGKHEGYGLHWIEWQWRKRRGAGLFEHQLSPRQDDGL